MIVPQLRLQCWVHDLDSNLPRFWQDHSSKLRLPLTSLPELKPHLAVFAPQFPESIADQRKERGLHSNGIVKAAELVL